MFSSLLSLTDLPLDSRIFFRTNGAFFFPCFLGKYSSTN